MIKQKQKYCDGCKYLHDGVHPKVKTSRGDQYFICTKDSNIYGIGIFSKGYTPEIPKWCSGKEVDFCDILKRKTEKERRINEERLECLREKMFDKYCREVSELLNRIYTEGDIKIYGNVGKLVKDRFTVLRHGNKICGHLNSKSYIQRFKNMPKGGVKAKVTRCYDCNMVTIERVDK